MLVSDVVISGDWLALKTKARRSVAHISTDNGVTTVCKTENGGRAAERPADQADMVCENCRRLLKLPDPCPPMTEANWMKMLNKIAELDKRVAELEPPPAAPEDFEQLWALSRRGSKPHALAKYKRAVPKLVSHAELMRAYKLHIAEAAEPQFIQHVQVFINQERWHQYAGGGEQGQRNFGQAARSY